MSVPKIARQIVLDFCDVIMRDALRGKETLTEGKNILIGAAKKELKILDQHYNKAINTIWEKSLNNSSNEKSWNQRAKISPLTKDMEEIKQMLVELEKNMTAMINACDNNYLSAESLKEEILPLNNINKEQLDRAFSIKESNQSTEKFADDFDEGYRAFIEAALKKYHKFKAIYDDAATVSVAAASSTPSVAASAPNLSTTMTRAIHSKPGAYRPGQLASIKEENNENNSNKGGTRHRRKRQTKRSKHSKRSKRTYRNRS